MSTTTEPRHKGGMAPRLKLLSEVHSRVHFCRSAALLRLSGGLDRLVCRLGKSEQYDLYLNGKPLVRTNIPRCGSCGTFLHAGYGDGLMHEEDCTAVRDRLNADFRSIGDSLDALAPIIGLMHSGLYLAADFDLFPVQRSANSYEYFWDAPDFYNMLHFHHVWPGGVDQTQDAPLFLAPSQRAADMNPAQVEHYRQRLQAGVGFPRAVALYLNGSVALLLDGHHKAAACAMEGLPVPTLVIFPVEEHSGLKAACAEGTRLYLHHSRGYDRRPVGPLYLRNGQGESLGQVSCLEQMAQHPLPEAPREKPEWGRIPDTYRTDGFLRYPNATLLEEGTDIPPDRIRTILASQMAAPYNQRDRAQIRRLQCYALLFPESKWLSPEERAWLERQ